MHIIAHTLFLRLLQAVCLKKPRSAAILTSLMTKKEKVGVEKSKVNNLFLIIKLNKLKTKKG